MKYSYVIFCPYFGCLPSSFNYWLASCEINKNFKFIVFTDDKKTKQIVKPDNVEVIYISFNDLVKNVQSKFSFEINIPNPYKLCDYKPIYGFIFSEYIDENCKYWGCCDMDMIFGDIEKFLPVDYVYDKISSLGHLTLYKNTEKITKAFMLKGSSKLDYVDILTSGVHFGFDEIGEYGINKIFEKNNLSIFPLEDYIADVSCIRPGMILAKYNNGKFNRDNVKKIFCFDGKSIKSKYLSEDKIEEIEYAYVHFQKRIMSAKTKSFNNFLILEDGFYENNRNEKEIINNINNRPIFWLKRRIQIKLNSLKKNKIRKQEISKIIKSKKPNI